MSSSLNSICIKINKKNQNLSLATWKTSIDEINNADSISTKSEQPIDLEFLTLNSRLFPENLPVKQSLNVKSSEWNKDYEKLKKFKKSKEEKEILESYFLKDPSWSRKTVRRLKKLLSLPVDKIYKWGYDKKLVIKKRSNPNFIDKRRKEYKLTNPLNPIQYQSSSNLQTEIKEEGKSIEKKLDSSDVSDIPIRFIFDNIVHPKLRFNFESIYPSDSERCIYKNEGFILPGTILSSTNAESSKPPSSDINKI